MITSVAIENLRGVRTGRVDALSNLSIFVGPNNSGKSTVLEAIAAVLAGDHAGRVVDRLLRRGGPTADALEHIVHRGAKKAKATIVLDTTKTLALQVEPNATRMIERVRDLKTEGLSPDKAYRVVVQLTGTPDGSAGSDVYVDPETRKLSATVVDYEFGSKPPTGVLVDVDAARKAGALEDAYTDIDRAKAIPAVVASLRRSMPGLKDLRILKSGSDFVLHSFTERADEPPVPSYLAGDGFKRYLELASAALAPDVDVVLLEEPESFQHPRYLAELATLLTSAAAAGRQVILSTHSIELIDLLLNAPGVGKAWPSVHRLRLSAGELAAVSLDRQASLVARNELLEDLRA